MPGCTTQASDSRVAIAKKVRKRKQDIFIFSNASKLNYFQKSCKMQMAERCLFKHISVCPNLSKFQCQTKGALTKWLPGILVKYRIVQM
jgi:hypothetical protein